MGKKLYVGNLSYETTDSDLDKLFAAHGTVQSAQVIMDRETGRSKGFGFVEMLNNSEADKAMKALNGTRLKDQLIKLSQAKPPSKRPMRGFRH